MLRLSRKMTWSVALAGCLGVTSLYGVRLMAQTRVSGAATPEEAAKEFLSFITNPQVPHSSNYNTGAPEALVAQKNLDTLGDGGVNRLFNELYQEFLVAHWKAEANINDKGDTAAVEFAPSNALKPVICVREDGRWRVDLMATYARWNELDEKTSLSRISEITGAIIPGVPVNSGTANAICQSNLKQIAVGLVQYTQDYDEKLPPANKWGDLLEPYIKLDMQSSPRKDEPSYNCPLVEQRGYGYAMNWKLSRKDMAAIAAPAFTVGFYESSVLRRNCNGDGKDLTFRHELHNSVGANYAYADGHVKFINHAYPQEFRIAPPVTVAHP